MGVTFSKTDTWCPEVWTRSRFEILWSQCNLGNDRVAASDDRLLPAQRTPRSHACGASVHARAWFLIPITCSSEISSSIRSDHAHGRKATTASARCPLLRLVCDPDHVWRSKQIKEIPDDERQCDATQDEDGFNSDVYEFVFEAGNEKGRQSNLIY